MHFCLKILLLIHTFSLCYLRVYLLTLNSFYTFKEDNAKVREYYKSSTESTCTYKQNKVTAWFHISVIFLHLTQMLQIYFVTTRE